MPRSLFLAVVSFVLLVAGVARGRADDLDQLPKASADATIPIYLHSNQQKTQFFIDDKWIATGKRLRVLVEDRPMTIRAKPEGYVEKEDFVQPPFRNGSEVGFYFLIEDKEQNQVAAVPAAPAPIMPPVIVPLPQTTGARPQDLTPRPPPAAAPAVAPGGEKRVALVIGNAAYPEMPLVNPVNDARAMTASLRMTGFEVIERVNAGKAVMEDAIAQFGERLGPNTVALVYYSGHGMQVSGKNYLIPVDAKISSEQTVALRTIDADRVIDQMISARTRLNILILDACRNNPFERRFRAVGGGLAQMSAPQGTMIAYSTAPGKVASDGEGTNGLYTQELLKALQQPGIEIEKVFKRVRAEVSAVSNEAQVPWEASSLVGDFYFVPPGQ
ncbi:MAG: caspase domain-containing protein [Alphaproteobacteria bacterium]